MLSEKRLLSRRGFLSLLPIVPMAAIPKGTQKSNICNPKFNIGDYVECRFHLEEDPNYYERGEIIGITLERDGVWDYSFIIRECPANWLIGQTDQGYEEQLTLLVKANT